jgi:hypothetical protein
MRSVGTWAVVVTVGGFLIWRIIDGTGPREATLESVVLAPHEDCGKFFSVRGTVTTIEPPFSYGLRQGIDQIGVHSPKDFKLSPPTIGSTVEVHGL